MCSCNMLDHNHPHQRIAQIVKQGIETGKRLIPLSWDRRPLPEAGPSVDLKMDPLRIVQRFDLGWEAKPIRKNLKMVFIRPSKTPMVCSIEHS